MRQMRDDVPVILSSGYNEAEAMRRFNGKGLAGFLQKPYRAGALIEIVQSDMRRQMPAATALLDFHNSGNLF